MDLDNIEKEEQEKNLCFMTHKDQQYVNAQMSGWRDTLLRDDNDSFIINKPMYHCQEEDDEIFVLNGYIHPSAHKALWLVIYDPVTKSLFKQ